MNFSSSASPSSLSSAFTQGMEKAKSTATKMATNVASAAATQMSLPMIQKFRKDLAAQMRNKTEWEKKPVEERQAIFNEVKEISKLLHLEGYRANMARNMGWSGGKKSMKKVKSSKGKKHGKSMKRRK